MTTTDQALTEYILHPAQEVEERITRGIEQHRKGDATVRVVDANGQPRPDVKVTIKQTRHQFTFSSNSFMLNGYPTDAENQRWSEAYTRLFNHTVVPFYWAGLEPQRGKPRYAANSEPVFRRPPPDAVLAWCRANRLTPKGHNLIWDILWPEWMPSDPEEQWRLFELRCRQIAERYGNEILEWDVANEILDRRVKVAMPPDYFPRSYQLAKKLFPPQAKLFVNETTSRSWLDYHHDTSSYYLMIDGLLQRGLRVDGIGMQFHLFKLLHEWTGETATILNPDYLLRLLDTYQAYHRPIHVSEVTVPAAGEVEDGEGLQAALTRGLYRTWFSHPAVEAIVYWNLADGNLWGNEGRFNGGLLHPDLTPKPVYEMLDELINSEWKTQQTLTTDSQGEIHFRGFLGEYSFSCASTPPSVGQLTKGGNNLFRLEV